MNMSDGEQRAILVVEDIEWIRVRMKTRLQTYGYRVLEATDDASAIEVAERESPSLILTEEQFPPFDALTTRLRRHAILHDLPIVIVNPDADEQTRYGDAVVLTDFGQIELLLHPQSKILEKES